MLTSIAIDTVRQGGQAVEKVKLLAVNGSRPFYESIGFHATEVNSAGDVCMEMEVPPSQPSTSSVTALSLDAPFIFDDRQMVYDAFGHPSDLLPHRRPAALNLSQSQRRPHA